jgi:hypothetical protein
MIARVNKDLRDLFEYVDHTKYNKFWRKFFTNHTYGYGNHKHSICRGLKEVKVCYDTIEKLSDVQHGYYKNVNNDIFTAILSNKKYTLEEQEYICSTYSSKINWGDVFVYGNLHFDLKVKYYKKILAEYKKNPKSEELTTHLKEIEREYKIRELLEDEG